MKKQGNTVAIKRLVRRTMSANRSRNRYIIAAIVLTTLLITSVFSIGMSFMESIKMQQIRLMGSTAHVAVSNPTDGQVEILRTLPYVKNVGLQHNVALIKATPQMGNMVLSLHWFDKEEWEKFRMPACNDIVGSYPDEYNEILVPLWVLRNMGFSDPKLGMEITLSFFLGEERGIAQTETFVLSGYYTGYMYIRSGNIDTIKVSKAFAQKSGNSVVKSGAASVTYKDSDSIEKYNEQPRHDLSLTEKQKVKTVPMYESSTANQSATVLSFAAVIFFLMFTGYLLIYNVFYISVSKDIRFYGLLKTIGASGQQLRRIVTGQALSIAAIGIPIGLAVGAALSFAVVPMALNLSDIETGVEISFSPIIFLGAALFALITTLMGAAKSAMTVAKVSAVEALRYTGAHVSGKLKCGAGGGKPLRMAWRNIFRDRKRAVVVLLSLFLGATTFMVITTLISSMDTDNYVASYLQSDIVLENNTLDAIATNSGGSQKQKFDAEYLSQLGEIDGITNMRTTVMDRILMAYDPQQFSGHMDWFREKFKVEEELTDQQIEANFWGYVIGLDARYVEEFNEDSDMPIDIKAFECGDIALIGTDEPELYSNIEAFDVDLIDASFKALGNSRQFKLGGFVSFGFQYAGGGMAPNIYISEEALGKLVSDPKIYKVNIDVDDNLEEQALEKIKELTEGNYEISRTSRLEQQEAMSDAKLMLFILGGGIALILATIGILNFINVMVTGVMARKRELAMLDSIGMTRGQMQRMLTMEGLGFACITVLLVGTLGSSLTYLIFKLFQQQADYAVFSFPAVQMLIAIAAVLAICAITPKVAYRSLCHDSVVERLREAE